MTEANNAQPFEVITFDPKVANIPAQLRDIADKVDRGEQPSVSVRELVSWFWRSKRRGKWVVHAIRNALNELKLATDPDFEWTYIDGGVKFISALSRDQNQGERAPENVTSQESEASHAIDAVVSVGDKLEMNDAVEPRLEADPMHRIARLKSAHSAPLSICPDAEMKKAITLMMKHNYSQLPVMSNRTLKGFISWKTIGRKLAMGKTSTWVREVMDEVQPSQVVSLMASLLEATQLVARHEFLLVRDTAQRICGIITAFDFTETFGALSEPFLLLGEIENHIRNLLNGKFSSTELEEVRDPLDVGRPINDVSDLNFGGYVRLLQNPNNWNKIQLQLDRSTFVSDLDEVREIRNDIMHFDPDGIAEDELKKVRDFANLLRQIQHIQEN
jgi:predicted transcriptional regulator